MLTVKILSSPFVGFFLMLIFAATLGDVIVIGEEKNVKEEYAIITAIYAFLVILHHYRPKRFKKYEE